MGLQSHPQRYLDEYVIQFVYNIANYHASKTPTKNFVMSDIHGMDKSFMNMLNLTTETAIKEGFTARYIFLGDYVDRGTGSAQVIAIIRLFQELAPDNVIALKGNHEDMFVAEHKYSSHPIEHYHSNTGRSFSRFGASGIPAKDVYKWLDKLPFAYEDDLHFYVHAGIRPGIALDKQKSDDLIWIREEFLLSNMLYPKYILHGHTPDVNGNIIKANRCCVDTGAVFHPEYYLTCVEIDPEMTFPIRIFDINNNISHIRKV